MYTYIYVCIHVYKYIYICTYKYQHVYIHNNKIIKGPAEWRRGSGARPSDTPASTPHPAPRTQPRPEHPPRRNRDAPERPAEPTPHSQQRFENKIQTFFEMILIVPTPKTVHARTRHPGFNFTESVYKVVLQKSIPAQIHQLVLYHYQGEE